MSHRSQDFTPRCRNEQKSTKSSDRELIFDAKKYEKNGTKTRVARAEMSNIESIVTMLKNGTKMCGLG